jgi:hypothetical protein
MQTATGYLSPLLAVVALACMPATTRGASGARLISGIYAKGHNLTEPRPKSSKFMKMVEAGFLVVPGYEAYYAEIEISKELPKPYFLRASFEDPQHRDAPFIEEAEIADPPSPIPMRHGPVKGLKMSHDYTITIEIFRKQGDAEPIDRIVQKVRSYIDTTGPVIKVKGGMKGP